MSRRLAGSRRAARKSSAMTLANGRKMSDSLKQEFTHSDVDSLMSAGTLHVVPSALDRAICRIGSHDWWALAYPPARRWECHRCGTIVEDAPTSLPDRRRVQRDPITKSNETDHA
jgi:hypothetical protein